jgi:nitrate reductase (cytochrome)
MNLSRRDYLKAHAAAVAGIDFPVSAANLITEVGQTALTWSKAPCRFCGTGCSVMVATVKIYVTVKPKAAAEIFIDSRCRS